MTNVFSEIVKWAEELVYWEQVALDKILTGVEYSDEDYDELLDYLLEENQLTERKSERKLLSFQKGLFQSADTGQTVLLNQITSLQNVNALVPGQTLTFGPQLTAIFGRNGSGKSGYARVLGCAGFTRGDRKVLPDVTKPVEEGQDLTADIFISRGELEKNIKYRVGRDCPELSSLYVFDSTSVLSHMCGKNAFSFSPAGLSVLKTLSDVTDQVRFRLNVHIEEKSKPVDFVSYFPGDSDIKEMVRVITIDTDLKQLKTLSRLTPEEEKHIHELNLEISGIALDKTQEEMDRLTQQIQDLKDLHTSLFVSRSLLDAERIQETDQIIADFNTLSNQVQQLSVDRFRNTRFSRTGTDEWHHFILAAKTLADAESLPNQPYPKEGEPCLLCQQPLLKDARNLLNNLWSYLEGEAQKNLENAEQLLIQKRSGLFSTPRTDISNDFKAAIKSLAGNNLKLSQDVEKQLTILRLSREALCNAIDSKKSVSDLPQLFPDQVSEINAFIKKLESELETLENQDLQERIETLENEKRILEHRKILGEKLPKIESHILDLEWAREAEKAGGSTHHITHKHNQIFNLLVKNRYITLFKQILEDLGRTLSVEIKTSGRKGQTVKQIVIKADRTARDIAEPEKVLSEGEKRAVALADFLTEVALDTNSSGIVLDDPVTSLDLEWRETIARILANAAKNRQVIVFTHDMPFLYLLLKSADDLDLDKQVHWIKRGDEDDKPGYVYLNNCPALESEYKKPTRAEEQYKNAIDAQPEVQEAILKDGFGALRTTYEALIVFELLNGTVLRFDERISFGRLEQIVWNYELVQEIIESCERLSRYIEGHLHSDAMASVTKLSPQLLRDEIDLYIDIKKRLRDIKSKPVNASLE